MNWVLALFAFAGVMAVMSTVVSVCVEAIHKVFGLRGRGLQDMLTALHDDVIAPIDPNLPDVTRPIPGPSSKYAKSFAKEMTRSPSYGSTSKYRHLANIPLLGLLSRRFQNLTKLQFVEQLPRTAFGQSLAGKPREEVRHTLNRVVYEFDRFGSGQTDFFRARAKILTTLVALVIVVMGNFNALTLYQHLATNDDTETSIQNLINNDAAMISSVVEQRRASIQAMADGGEVASEQLVAEVAAQLRDMSELGFPVGRQFFPYCSVPTNPGCSVEPAFSPVPLFPMPGTGHWYVSEAIPRMFTPEGFQWFIGMVATAGLIGLGSPFWFTLFKSMAGLVVRSQALTGNAKSAGAAVSGPALAPGELRRPKQPNPSLATPGDEPDLDVLTDAFLIVSGKDTGAAPVGRRLGAASADLTGDAPITAPVASIAPIASSSFVSADELGAPASNVRNGTDAPLSIRHLRS